MSGTPRGSPRLGEQAGKAGTLPDPARTSLGIALGWNSLQGQQGQAGPVQSRRGLKGGVLKDNPRRVPRPINKEIGGSAFGAREEWIVQKAGMLPCAPETAGIPSDERRAAHETARGRGLRERARGLTRLGGAARMLGPARSGRGGRPGAPGRGRSARAAAPDRRGLGRGCSAQRRALPEPGLACAAAPWRRRRRRQRLPCRSSSGHHGQGQRGAHPRAARYEVASVPGTPRPGASQTQRFPARGTPQPGTCTPVRPRSKAPPTPSSQRGHRCPRSILLCSPHPIRTFLSWHRPSRSPVTGAILLR